MQRIVRKRGSESHSQDNGWRRDTSLESCLYSLIEDRARGGRRCRRNGVTPGLTSASDTGKLVETCDPWRQLNLARSLLAEVINRPLDPAQELKGT